MTEPKFKFREELVCQITGFKGRVTAITESFGGQIRYSLQPKVDEHGKFSDPYGFDESQLERTPESSPDEGQAAKWEFKFNFLDQVEDIFSGFRGKIGTRVEFANGCVRYGVRPTIGRSGKKVADDHHAFEQELKLISANAEIEPPAKTGGPIEKAPFY